ncbi:MFS transporter [Roseiarcaceae bacterium H3SJ34-1]|uniref:MFS transporter n=1 Tax=Terripilifer ovatus TaxID=3032367 RepID=UPI003AB92102|nr:MFS transporter [Roseiarcaceae bacterium H3SJ34-1]
MDKRLLILALGTFALGTDSFVVAGVLPEISHAFGVGIGAAGQMTTIYAITYALLAPTIAAVAASVPRKRLLLSGLSLFVVANLATAFSPTFSMALLSRAIAGLGAAIFSPTAMGAGALLVPPERRGFALAVIVAGLTTATAIGSPAGAVIGGLGDWRWTMGFVSALGAASLFGVWAFLPEMPLPPAIALRQRLAPLADARIALTLATTLLAMTGIFIPYTYFAVVFDRAIGGNAAMIGALLVAWGLAGTLSNLLAGHLIDTMGSRKVLVAMLIALVIDIALTPWTGAHVWSSILAIAIWGACGWGILVPQQHRLVTLAPSIAPVVVGLNTSGTYLGVTMAGVIGAAGIGTLSGHELGFIAAAILAVALLLSEIASRRIAAHGKAQPLGALCCSTTS